MKIGIIGMGLMGASLSKAILKYTDNEVYGYDADKSVLKKATETGAHTRALIPEDDLISLDMLVFALRPRAAMDEMQRLCGSLKEGAIVTDICGVKKPIVEKMRELKKEYPELNFVSMHPMAGKECGGFDNSDGDLFDGAYIVAVPVDCEEAKYDILKNLYLNIGARGVEVTTAERHDEMIAYTSQLAHATSSCYVQNPLSSDHAGYSAGSFADLTRVARLDADMWTELFLENSDSLVVCLDDIIDRLKEVRGYISAKDENALRNFLRRGTECKQEADIAQKEWKQ